MRDARSETWLLGGQHVAVKGLSVILQFMR
jgi:hypothetical protein